MPDRLYFIGSGSFQGCDSLKQVIIPYGVAIIPSEAFGFCDALEEVVISDTVELIEDHAFTGFQGKVVFKGTKKEWETICIEDSKVLNKVRVEYSE